MKFVSGDSFLGRKQNFKSRNLFNEIPAFAGNITLRSLVPRDVFDYGFQCAFGY